MSNIIINRQELARVLTLYLSQGRLCIPDGERQVRTSLQMAIAIPCVGTVVLALEDGAALDMLAQLENCHTERKAILADAFEELDPIQNWR